jgi:hypothetical protein
MPDRSSVLHSLVLRAEVEHRAIVRDDPDASLGYIEYFRGARDSSIVAALITIGHVEKKTDPLDAGYKAVLQLIDDLVRCPDHRWHSDGPDVVDCPRLTAVLELLERLAATE